MLPFPEHQGLSFRAIRQEQDNGAVKNLVSFKIVNLETGQVFLDCMEQLAGSRISYLGLVCTHCENDQK